LHPLQPVPYIEAAGRLSIRRHLSPRLFHHL
jgi:hypothetical protein